MSDRLTVNTITSDALDDLYDLIAHLAACLSDAYDLPLDVVLDEARQAIADKHARSTR